ncbi:hypothetical protein [Ferroacidibacillus organovorans]|uniref:hypothetical protein n=1 Tax=Ferroacidibacillus organovorans TaxID=1765683 RepID=UPI0012E8DF66|nr:hypothetical protein [Ferroacidibacillus organovorans]
MGDVRKVVTPDLEKSFSKQTQGMKSVIERAMQQGTIKQLTNRAGKSVEVSKIKGSR